MSVQEVIDLTTEDPVVLAVNILDASANSSRDSRKLKRKKKISKPSSPEVVPLNDSNERSPKFDHSPKRRRTSGSHERHSPTHPGEPDKPDSTDLFFVDLSPIPVPQELSSTTNDNEKVDKLLLPSHVTVFGNALVEIISQPLSDSDDDEFIRYLDYEDTRNVPRYYDEPPNQTSALDRAVCKNCGAEGDHKTSACTVQICLTCGVRNEHSTRSCPISKVCFTCGMKGHINANCPNRHSRNYTAMRNDDCARCSSSYHKTNECPTWWRLYEYLASEDQTRILARRLSKKDSKLGEGGEGYVADDEWCYNCGNPGHWGDDCHNLSNTRSLGEYSAFGNNNVMSGPFFDPSQKPKTSSSRSRTRDWERADQMFKVAPGRQGRMKSMAALEKKSRQAEDDPDDWFGNNFSKSNGPAAPGREPKKISFGKSFKDERQRAALGNRPPSLLARMGADDSSQPNQREGRRSGKSRNKNDNRHQCEEGFDSSDYANGYRHGIPAGPRYRAGYGR